MLRYVLPMLMIAVALTGCGSGDTSIRAPSREAFSYDPWNRVLRAYVDDRGYVDYEGVRGDSAFWRFIAMINGARPSAMSSREQLAFWVNAYNALTFQLIVDNLDRDGEPLGSITDIAGGLVGIVSPITSPWELEVAEIEGRTITLQEIEDERVRALGDERIHFAINCASISCPKVLREAYTVGNYDRLTEKGRRDYLSDSAQNSFKDGKLRLSKIFDWYEDDFVKAAGSVPAYVAKYWPDPDQAKLIAGIPPDRIEYVEYDWGLVSQPK